MPPLTPAASGTCNVRTDLGRNVLYITLEGFFTLDQVRAACAEILRAARRLRPGFALVNDIRTFKPASQEAVSLMTDTQKAISALKPRRVVRVVGASATASMQLSRTGRTAGYDANTVGTLEEAEALLA